MPRGGRWQPSRSLGRRRLACRTLARPALAGWCDVAARAAQGGPGGARDRHARRRPHRLRCTTAGLRISHAGRILARDRDRGLAGLGRSSATCRAGATDPRARRRHASTTCASTAVRGLGATARPTAAWSRRRAASLPLTLDRQPGGQRVGIGVTVPGADSSCAPRRQPADRGIAPRLPGRNLRERVWLGRPRPAATSRRSPRVLGTDVAIGAGRAARAVDLRQVRPQRRARVVGPTLRLSVQSRTARVRIA